MLLTNHSLFFWPILIAAIGFVFVWFEAGLSALFLVIILSILEITLSFDNAIVNAKALERMDPVWQKRFLTWGIVIAVFGTRFLLPILIVSVAAALSPLTITHLAFTEPETYRTILSSIEGSITVFGGMFLLMVSLSYFFRVGKAIPFVSRAERHLEHWCRVGVVEIALAVIVLIGVSFATHHPQLDILLAGLIGITLFVAMEGVSYMLSLKRHRLVSNGLALFIYLNVLDAAFSLDGVIGAFALSTNLLIIMTGLGVGALFVRALTVYLVKQKTLSHLIYLEQGAEWAIFGLASAMLIGVIAPVPPTITGLIGLVCISVAFIASLRARAR
jgi:uncharacterized protein